jgi:hypothetical protein
MLQRDAAAAVVYQDLKQSSRVTFQVAADYGKWLTSSLLLIHGGALFGMFTFLDSLAEKPDALSLYTMPVWAFVIGLLLALATGFFVWLNWSMHSDNYSQMARYDMLWDPDQWVDDPPHNVGITITYWLPIIFGWLSVLCVVIGVFLILHGGWLRAVLAGDAT